VVRVMASGAGGDPCISSLASFFAIGFLCVWVGGGIVVGAKARTGTSADVASSLEVSTCHHTVETCEKVCKLLQARQTKVE
jgi:hypothetical protein